ncbi:unnamed protein product [Pseudo-nitzschia multistriata]|uniref:Uncharacterized protein n=1 Tax=Pseudo-nitzschia multistriata TaxID=183589 RepID=A0A448ZEM3_9STRA|nr:unnamed protein product [Pseudo-nitzschia multistriata]
MKRFNTDRIRQRMREQNERFPSSKGKLLSSAPVRISVSPQSDKENIIPSINNRSKTNISNVPINSAENDNIKPRKFPQLSISVTMSEGDEDQGIPTTDVVQNETSRVSDDGDDSTVPSVWAMMEHYQSPSKDRDSRSDEVASSKKSLAIVEDDCERPSTKGRSPNSVGSSLCSVGTHKTPFQKNDNENYVKPKMLPEAIDALEQKDAIKVPSKIHWLQDDGELVQSSFYSQGEVSDIAHLDEIETSNNDLSTVDEEDQGEIFRPDTAASSVEQAVSTSTINFENLRNRTIQPTPARVRQEWVASEDDEDLSSHPGSLLQESMIHSLHLSLHGDSRGAAEKPSHVPFLHVQTDDISQHSISSPKESTSESNVKCIESSGAPTASGSDQERDKSQVPEENTAYLDRLGELESSLRMRQNNTDEVQGRLRERVLELEQALKLTVATPRGTIVDENPLKTLLDRNQTLVKEVRFADQTCVELSSKLSELQTLNGRLKKQVVALEQEKEELQNQVGTKEETRSKQLLEKDQTIERLKEDLAMANKKLAAKTLDEKNTQAVMKKAFESLGLSDDALGYSIASSIVSEQDSIAQDHSLCRQTLEQQVEVMLECAKKGQQVQQMAQKSDELRAENDALKSELNQLRARKASGAITPMDNSNEMLQTTRENEFLGRQLGIVQERLDQTQSKLRDECHRSESLKVHLVRSMDTYEGLIEPFERRLIEATKFSHKFEGIGNVDEDLLSLEKEFGQIKVSISLMKRESELFLTTSTSNFETISDLDQNKQIVTMAKATFSRLGQHYKQLEIDVEKMVEGFSDRLDCLSETVSHLRSSLLFEKESVSSCESNTAAEMERDVIQNHLQQGTTIDVIKSTIPTPKSRISDEDEMYTLMEEARIPRTDEISISSDLDDISRLLHDDMTLESIVRTGSVFTSTSNMDMFKDSLETAMNECKRVKERSIKLKEQIESQNDTIQKLEQENGKLSLAISRRNEEYCLVEKALQEAKEEIEGLRCTVASIQSDNEAHCLQMNEQKRESTVIVEENDRLMKSVVQIQKQKETFEARINECEKSLALTKAELECATSSCDEYKERFEDLQAHFSTKIYKVTEQKELESAETRRALQVALHESCELKRLHHEAVTKLSKEVESKLRLEALVNELQNYKMQVQSDLEDRTLESQFAYEDMRKERAELKSKLSQSEKEATSLKELYANLKGRMQMQIEESSRKIQEIETQKSSLLSNIHKMTDKRIAFHGLIADLQCCKDLKEYFISKENNSVSLNKFESAMNEIDCWNSIIPLITDEIESMHHTSKRIPDLKDEIEQLNDNLSKYEIRQTDQMKHAKDQSTQNEKLFDLLRQAEEEMERSSLQIQEMSEAMVAMQQREYEANHKFKVMESELCQLKTQSKTSAIENNEEFAKMKSLLLDTSATLEKKDSQMMEMNSQMNNLKSEVNEVTALLRSKDAEEHSLRVNIESCEKKNARLREYIRKLTNKCEEWEGSYDRQSRAIERLQEKNTRIKEKACDIAGRYRALVADVNRRKKMHKHDREKWSNERSNLTNVHAALEQELEQIAKELA